jgi:hypothetical protein
MTKFKSKFGKKKCDIYNADPHDVELLIIGNPISDQAGSNTLLYNFKTNTTCVVEKIPGGNKANCLDLIS